MSSTVGLCFLFSLFKFLVIFTLRLVYHGIQGLLIWLLMAWKLESSLLNGDYNVDISPCIVDGEYVHI